MNEYNERILKTVLQDYRAENDDALLKELEDAKNDPLFQVSDEEAKAFAQNYIKKTQKKKNSKIFLKAASVILSIILAGAVFIPVTVEGRKCTLAELVLNFVNSEFVAIGNNEDDSRLLSYEGEFFPSYIPEGYYVESVNNTDNVKNITLKNNDGKTIMFTEYAATTNNNADYEKGVEITDITLLGYNGIYYSKDDTQHVAVLADDTVLMIFCNDNEINLTEYISLVEKR